MYLEVDEEKIDKSIFLNDQSETIFLDVLDIHPSTYDRGKWPDITVAELMKTGTGSFQLKDGSMCPKLSQAGKLVYVISEESVYSSGYAHFVIETCHMIYHHVPKELYYLEFTELPNAFSDLRRLPNFKHSMIPTRKSTRGFLRRLFDY